MARVGFFIAGFNGDDRDYFAFPIPGDYTVESPPASYLMPFNEAYNFVYRYKTLRFDFDVTMDNGFGDLSNISGSLTTNNIPLAITDENHIGRQPYIRQFSATTDESTGEGAFVDVMLNTFIDPDFEMYLDVAVQTQFGEITTSPVGGPASLVLSILGHNIQMYCSLSTTGSVDVTVDEWWGYNDGTGDTWDTTDGHQLINPVPINFSP
jgi:hypothetical protein